MTTEYRHIVTLLSLGEYREYALILQGQILDAAIDMVLSSDSVARTWALATFGEWFSKQGAEVCDYLLYASWHGDDEWGCGEEWTDVTTDLRVHWTFTDEDKALALLFKLTFGGN